MTSGKITGGTDVPKVAQLLSESSAFYDAEMIAGLINAMLLHDTRSSIAGTKDGIRIPALNSSRPA